MQPSIRAPERTPFSNRRTTRGRSRPNVSGNSRVLMIDRVEYFDDIWAHLVMLEFEHGRTLVHLRASSPAELPALAAEIPLVFTMDGQQLRHEVSQSGGSGVETHIFHVHEGIPINGVTLRSPRGKDVFSAELH